MNISADVTFKLNDSLKMQREPGEFILKTNKEVSYHESNCELLLTVAALTFC